MRIELARIGPVVAATVLAGLCTSCEKKPQAAHAWSGAVVPTAAAAAAPQQAKAFFQGTAQQAPGLHLAYTHAIGLEVGGGALAAHFNAARDRCLNTPALHCLLLQSEIYLPPAAAGYGGGLLGAGRPLPGGERPLQGGSASLRVRLPHDQIAGFANSLTETLPGEQPGLVRVLRQSTTAQDLGQPITDVNQRVSQLQDYLTSLKALGSRLTISVSDLVKIATETAQAQTQIEAAQAEQRDLTLRVDTEELDIDFQAAQSIAAPQDPIDQVLADSQDILHQNEADALRFAIAALPWVPVGFAGLIVLWIARRLIFGARRRPVVAAPMASPARQAPVLSGYRPLDE
jgi:hypothetical protein